jgi:hypothetical protein
VLRPSRRGAACCAPFRQDLYTLECGGLMPSLSSPQAIFQQRLCAGDGNGVLASHNRSSMDSCYCALSNPKAPQKLRGKSRKKVLGGQTVRECRNARNYCETAASSGNFARRHHFNSWLSSVTSIPAITMNLQLSISRGSSSSGSWQDTRQYWHS